MCKAILSVVVVCALASVASAVPTGPGGTVYFPVIDIAGANQEFFYLDVDSNWDPLITTGGAVVSFATVQDDAGQTSNGYGARSGWYHPTSGKLDMNGSYHDGYILVGSYYNTTPALTIGTGLERGVDLLAVGVGGTTILNDGVDCSQWTNCVATATHRWQLTVDSGFTPNGEAQGFATSGNAPQGVWVDSDGDSAFIEGADPGEISTTGNWQKAGNYSACTGTVNGETVTGAITNWKGTGDWCISYKNASGGYQNIYSYVSDADASYVTPYTGGAGWLLAGDTDNDGQLDVYYHGSSGHGLIHGVDTSGDGDVVDAGETWVTGYSGSWITRAMQLVQCPDGSWVILEWGFDNRTTGTQNYTLKVVGLDEYGDYDASGAKMILNCTITTAGVVTGDESLSLPGSTATGSYVQDGIIFLPLGEAGGPVIPEPTTLLLVGTGVLGLAGVVRRRLLG